MANELLPFNIELLKLTDKDVAVMRPVTSLDYYENRSGQLNDDGLFSVPIFGRIGEEARDQRFSYMRFGATIFHPVIFQTLVKLRGFYEKILSGTAYAVFDEKEKDFVQTDELHGTTGFNFFMTHWKKIDFKRSPSSLRDVRIKLIEKYKDRAEIDKFLILPAGLRDIEQGEDGRPVVGEVNPFYRKMISIANAIVVTSGHSQADQANLPRLSLQHTANDVYDYFTKMLSGKGGFMQNRWGARRVASGTRNVISAMNASSAKLGSPKAPKFDDIQCGLFQGLTALLPVAVYALKTHYVADIFSYGNGQARLVDPKTLKGELVDVSVESFDKWTTNEGLEKIINGFREPTHRLKPVKVDGYYLALIYKGPDHTFKVFSGMDEFPDKLDKKYVSPINYTELIYLSGYKAWERKYYGFVTRYPITGTGSIYPASIYIRTTTEAEERRELDAAWEPMMDDDHLALEFPRADVKTFLESLVLPSTRLEGLSADFDGDTASLNAVMTDEAIEACKKYLSRKTAYLDPRGGLRASSSTVTSELIFRSMTG